ncbi:MAG: efflux RND transporter periplasmic adaptor subunit [Microcystaceae cyanobacterium]
MFYRKKTQNRLISTAITLSLLTVGCGGNQAEAPQRQAVPVKLQELKTATLIDSSQYVGNLVSKSRVNVASKIRGRILEIRVQPGEQVSRGQTLIVLEPEQQQEDVNAATGSLNQQKALLNQTEANLRTLQAQRDAAASEVSNQQAQIANSQANAANAVENLKRSEAELTQAKANFNLAGINLKRSKVLVEGGAVAQQDLDDKQTAFDDEQANVQALTNNVEASKASVQASEASVKSAFAALEQAQKNLVAADQRVEGALAEIDAQKAAIDTARGNLGSIQENFRFNFVPAPINGTVGNFDQYKVGDVVEVGQVITTLTDNQLFDLNVDIPVENESRLRMGLPVEIIKSDGTIGVRGQVTYIAPLTTQNTQSILTKVTFENDGSLRDEQFVRVRMIWNTQPGVLVPTTAVTSLGSQKFVFVAKEGEKDSQGKLVATQVPVTVGAIQGQAYQVVGGVKAGDRIAVSRILDLRDQTPITDESTVQSKAQ